MSPHRTAADPDPLAAPDGAGRNRRRLWTAITAALVATIFTEAVFAGAMLSGEGWARSAHRADASLLIAAAAVAGLAAIVTLRRIPRGKSLGVMLLMLAAAVFVQFALGKSTAHGANLLWLHVPLGVALVGLATHALAAARRLGDE